MRKKMSQAFLSDIHTLSQNIVMHNFIEITMLIVNQKIITLGF